MKNEKYLITITEKGILKVSSNEEIKTQARAGSGLRVVTITKDTGSVVDAIVMTGYDNSVMVVTESGMGIKFLIKDIRVMGRTATGVRAIRLPNGDKVVSLCIV